MFESIVGTMSAATTTTTTTTITSTLYNWWFKLLLLLLWNAIEQWTKKKEWVNLNAFMDKVYLQRTAYIQTYTLWVAKSDANCERNHWWEEKKRISWNFKWINCKQSLIESKLYVFSLISLVSVCVCVCAYVSAFFLLCLYIFEITIMSKQSMKKRWMNIIFWWREFVCMCRNTILTTTATATATTTSRDREKTKKRQTDRQIDREHEWNSKTEWMSERDFVRLAVCTFIAHLLLNKIK